MNFKFRVSSACLESFREVIVFVQSCCSPLNCRRQSFDRPMLISISCTHIRENSVDYGRKVEVTLLS
jgi:hypothetical protein